MEKKELYYNLTKKYFDVGLMREVYISDRVSVCNLSNSFYVVVPFDLIQNNIPPVGAVTDKDGLKEIIKDDTYAYGLIDHYFKTKQDKYLIPINDDMFKIFMPIKQKRDAMGTVSDCIDLQLEEEIMARNKSK